MNKEKIKMYVFEYNENNGNFHRNQTYGKRND